MNAKLILPMVLLAVLSEAHAQDKSYYERFKEYVTAPFVTRPAPQARPQPKPQPRVQPRPVVKPKPQAPASIYARLNNLWVPQMEAMSGPVATDPYAPYACSDAYSKINSKNYHRIVVGIGYADGIPNNDVSDPLVKAALHGQLTSACNNRVSRLCGFRPLPNDPSVLRKRVSSADGRGFRTIDLKLIGGALTQDNKVNTSAENKAKQMAMCQANEDAFHNEIENGADTIIYWGHSRNGGGPDFCPPIVTADGQHVNYSVYKARRPGINGVTASLRTARKNGKKNMLMALMSCSSDLHFERRLKAAAPDMGLILTSRTVTFGHIYHDTLAIIAGSVDQVCKEPLQEVLDEGESHKVKKASSIINFM